MNEIIPVQPGGGRTFLSAGLANEVIRAVNALRRMRGRNGVRVTVSDSDVVIEGSGARTTTPGGGEGGAGDGLIWGGEWDSGTEYADKTIVMRSSEAALLDGDLAGSYIAKSLVPAGSDAPGTVGGATYWETFAQYSSDVFVVHRNNTEIRLDTRASVGLPELAIESNRALNTGARVVMSLDDLDGKYARFVEVDVCVAGVAKKMLVLGTDPYIP